MMTSHEEEEIINANMSLTPSPAPAPLAGDERLVGKPRNHIDERNTPEITGGRPRAGNGGVSGSGSEEVLDSPLVPQQQQPGPDPAAA